MVGGERFEDRGGGVEEDLGVDVVEFGCEPELLADRRLCDAQSLSDLTLAHATRHHRAQREDASQSRDAFATTGIAILGHESHKITLSSQHDGLPSAPEYQPP